MMEDASTRSQVCAYNQKMRRRRFVYLVDRALELCVCRVENCAQLDGLVVHIGRDADELNAQTRLQHVHLP
jgi:hypothetical protein